MTTAHVAAQSVSSAEQQQSTDQAAQSQARAALAGVPLAFEPNRGQMDSAVQYAAKGSRYTLSLTSSEAVFALPQHLELPASLKAIAAQTAAQQTNQPSRWTAISMRLVGANPEPSFSSDDRLPGIKNYYIGRDKSKWAEGVPLYGRVQEQDVYPGIDMVFYGIDRQLEFDFLVNPGADPRQIKLAFSGAEHVRVDPSGNLILSSGAGDLEIHRPAVYQATSDGEKKMVSAGFIRGRKGEIKLALGPYDHKRELIIDPSVIYSTYLGGSSGSGGTGQDMGLGIAVGGNMTYVTGATASANFPYTPGSGTGYQGGGYLDVFVTAFNATGQLVFSTIVGGNDGDAVGTSLALGTDEGGSVALVTGYSRTSNIFAINSFCGNSSCFPTTSFLCGTQNAIILAVNATTGYYNPNVSAFVGGSQSDVGLAITTDHFSGGHTYLAGQTTSPDFFSCNPLSNESEINLGHGSGPSDAFVAKWGANTDTSATFSTFLGGSNNDFATGIAIDNPGASSPNIFVTGGTVSSDFYTYPNPGAFQTTCGSCGNGQDDAFVTELCTATGAPCDSDETTPKYVYSTFLGGSGKDDANSIVADINGNAYVTGQTASQNFPLQNPYQGTLKGSQNAFVSKLGPGGTALVSSTYLGGSGSDAGLGIAIDSQTNIYVTGRTNSPNFPLESFIYPYGGGYDAFISSFDPTGTLLTFSTYLGGSGDEDVLGGAIAVDSTQNVYVTGDTNSANFPVTNQSTLNMGANDNCMINGQQVTCPDAFVAKINATPGNEATLTVTVSGTESSDLMDSVSWTTLEGTQYCYDYPNNPGTCVVGNYTLGSQVTLVATPGPNDIFVGWSGDASSCGTNLTCQIQINGATNATASFSGNPSPPPVLFQLTLSGEGVTGVTPGSGVITSTIVPGTGNGGQIDCGDGQRTCTAEFDPGTQVQLTATPDSGSYFYGWSGNLACSGTGTCTITMISDQTVDYFFASNSAPPPQPDFTITLNPQSLGTISVGSQGIAGVAIATLNGFTDTVNLTCSVLPASASSPACSVNPSSLDIPLNGAGSATLTVNTTGLMAKHRKHTSATLALCFPFLGLLGLGVKSRSFRGTRCYLRILLSVLLFGALCFEIACGSSGGGGISGGVAQPGTYTVVLNAQGAATQITHTAQVTVTVQ